MYKTVGIYNNVTDSKAFEKYYLDKVFPRLITFPGVVCVKITNLMDPTRKEPPNMEDIQFIIETHYETIEELRKIVETPEGKSIIKAILGNTYATCGRYIGEAKTFEAKDYQNQP